MQTTTPTAPESRSTEFVPVSGGGETTSAEALLVTAYILFWAIFFGFLLMTWRKITRVDKRLDDLAQALSKARPAEH